MKLGAGWALVLVLCFAAVLRGWAVHESTHTPPLSDAPTIDEASYDEWAVDIASGDWTGEEVFFQEPLYPYFLGCVYAVSGRDLDVVRIIQVVLGVLSCWLVARLGRRLAGDWAGVLGALLRCGGLAALHDPGVHAPDVLQPAPLPLLLRLLVPRLA